MKWCQRPFSSSTSGRASTVFSGCPAAATRTPEAVNCCVRVFTPPTSSSKLKGMLSALKTVTARSFVGPNAASASARREPSAFGVTL
jgi:hypothetical protein